MRKSKIRLLFISMLKRAVVLLVFVLIFLWRWVGQVDPVPELWNKQDEVSLTITLLEKPEYDDSKTIVRTGIWYIPIKGYFDVIPGSRVKITGKIEPKKILGKVVQARFIDPKAEVIGQESCLVCNFYLGLGNLRDIWVHILGKVLPEPMVSLAAGILLGIKAQMPELFYKDLVGTGTLHVVAASGYNVSIVAVVLMKIASMFFRKKTAILFGVSGIVLYVIISGASASVMRAGIMGSLTLIAYYFGRQAEAKRLLWMSAAVMIINDPLMPFDIGFQLSVGATIGLLYFEKSIHNFGNKILGKFRSTLNLQAYLAEYLYPTLAATLATLPIILWHFGRVSWISPLVNMLILPFVPLIMLLTAIVLGIGMLTMPLAQVVAWIAYIPLAWMVWVIQFFGRFG